MNKKNILIGGGIAIVLALLAYFGLQGTSGTQTTLTAASSTTVKIDTAKLKTQLEAALRTRLTTEIYNNLKSTIKPQLRTIYELPNYNLDSLIESLRLEIAAADTIKEKTKKIFIAEGDTNFVVKDSLGRTRDSVKVKGKYVSPVPLHSAGYLLLQYGHTSYSYDETKTTKEKSLLDNIQPGLVMAYGIGIRTKEFDTFIGAGAKIDIYGLINYFKGE